jgi:HSF-type DNA-binding
MNTFNADEKAAAAAISGIMNGNFTTEKRGRDDDAADSAAGVRPSKMARAVVARQIRELKPAPYFYYRDHSMEADPDPLTPLTPPGRVPNFPAKMHAILSRKDFADIVAWLPHGRSWRVLKPREFEVKVIPKVSNLTVRNVAALTGILTC